MSTYFCKAGFAGAWNGWTPFAKTGRLARFRRRRPASRLRIRMCAPLTGIDPNGQTASAGQPVSPPSGRLELRSAPENTLSGVSGLVGGSERKTPYPARSRGKAAFGLRSANPSPRRPITRAAA